MAYRTVKEFPIVGDVVNKAVEQPVTGQLSPRDAMNAAQEQAGRKFSAEQRWWLDKIAEHVAVNVAISENDLASGEFYNRGGLFRARQAFGNELAPLLEELNGVLVA